MFTVKLDSLICWLVDKNLDRSFDKVIRKSASWGKGKITRPGIYLEFPIEVRNWTGKGDNDSEGEYITHRKQVFMVFAGNTSVWYQVKNLPLDGKLVWSEFENSSNHDSCWQSDGLRFLSQEYFDMCKDLDPDKAPIKMDSDIYWGLFNDMRKCFVTYEYETDEYKRTLVDVNKWED